MKQQVNKPSLKKNVIFNIIYQLVQIGVPIILIPILSGRLKTDGSGNYAFIHSIVLYFSYFALLGVNLFGTRAIARTKTVSDDEKKKTFWSIFIAKSFTSIIAIGGYLTFALIYNQNQFVVYTQLFFLLANFLDVSWFFSGEENFKSLCIRNLIVKTLSLVFIVLFVHTQNDIGIYSLILGLAEAVNQGFMWGLLFKKKIFRKEYFKELTKKDVLIALKGMAIFFVPQLLIELYTILNVTILGAVYGSTGSIGEVGIFDYANKIVSVLTTITVSLGLVFLARLSSLNEENKSEEVKQRVQQSLYYSLFIALPMVVGVIGTGHSFVQWFLTGDDWSKVGTLLYFLPLKVIFVAISNTLGVQYLISTGKIKKYILSVAIGAITCIALNAALVKPFGAIGSSIAVVVAEASVTVVQIILVRKEIDVWGVLKSFWKPVVAAAVMGGFLAISYLFLYDSMLMFFTSIFKRTILIMSCADFVIIICGALLYFAVLILLKEKTILDHVLRKVRIKKQHDAFVSATLLTVVIAMSISFGLYRPYNIKFEAPFTIQRRAAAASYDASNNRVITHEDKYIEPYAPLSTIDPAVSETVLDTVNNTKSIGFSYHINEELEAIDMFTYKFYFFQCLDFGTTFKVNLKYCIQYSNFLKENLDRMNICVCVKSFEHEDAPSVCLILNNSDETISKYFANPRRDFIAYNGSTILWKDDDFKCEKNGSIIYKDNYYCIVSVFFADTTVEVISPDINKANVRQEVWLFNGK